MKKKIIGLMLVITTLSSMFSVIVFASERVELTSSIANIEMSDLYLDSNHTQPLGDTAVTKDTELFAGLSVAFNEDNQPTSGSTEYYYTFPPEINMTEVHNGILYDGAKTAGTYTIADGEVRFSFNDAWLKANSSAIKTQFDFSFKVDEDTIGDGGEKTIVFPGVGEITLDTVSEVGAVSKRNSLASMKDDGTIEYEIELNVDHDVRSASIIDYLDVKGAANSKAAYVAGSFKLDGAAVADDDVKIGTHKVQSSSYPSFTIPASGGIALSAGTHKLTYKVKYNDDDLFGWETVTRTVNNTARWTLDGNDTDNVTSTVNLENTPVAKNHSQVKVDSVTNKSYVEWTLTVNGGNAPTDMSNAQIRDNLWGDHTYSDLANTLKVTDEAGNDVTSKFTLNYTEGGVVFYLLFPSDAGRQKYTITYRTELGDNYESGGYNNRAYITNSSGESVSVSDGDGTVGIGEKSLDYSNIDADMLSGGGGEYGQADWVVHVNGLSFPEYTKFILYDYLRKPTDSMWYKRSTNAYDAGVIPEIPHILYTAENGSEQELEFGTDFNIVYGLDGSQEMFTLTFLDTPAVRQAFKGDFYVKYSTQSVGSVSPGDYGNYLEFYYNRIYIESYDVHYSVDEESNLYKEVTETTKLDDGSYKILWNAIVNGNNTDGKPTSPNMEINGENIIITDTLPAGTKLSMKGNRPEYLQFRVKGPDGANVRDWSNVDSASITSLTVTDNSDGTQTFTIVMDTTNLWKPKGSTRYMVYLRYLTVTDGFAEGEYGTKTVTNNITAQTDTRSMGHADATTQFTNTAVDKTAAYITGSGNQVKYTIHVNDQAVELNNGEALALWDQFDPSLSLVDGTLKVYLGDTSTELEGWTIAGETVTTDDGRIAVKYTIGNLPDSTHLRVEYNTTVTGEIGDTVDVENTAALVGFVDHSSTVSTEVRIEKSSGQASGASGKIEILKLNSENINEKLEGAEFKLYSVNLTNGNETLEAVKRSDQDGLVVFDQNASGSALMLDTLYYYQETEAPEGYALDDTKYYFMLKGDNYDSAFQRAVTLLGGNTLPSAGTSYSAFNQPEKKKLVAEKTWVDYQGNTITGEALEEMPEITLNVTRSYTDAGDEVHSEQFEIRLNSENGWHYEEEFNANAPSGEEYTFEAAESELEGYTSEVTVTDGKLEVAISAINTENNVPVELPDTGGAGVGMFLLLGTSLIALGIFSGFMLKKNKLASAKIHQIFFKKGNNNEKH